MRGGMPQGIVVLREWEDLGYAEYERSRNLICITSSNVDPFKIIKFLNILPLFAQ